MQKNHTSARHHATNEPDLFEEMNQHQTSAHLESYTVTIACQWNNFSLCIILLAATNLFQEPQPFLCPLIQEVTQS